MITNTVLIIVTVRSFATSFINICHIYLLANYLGNMFDNYQWFEQLLDFLPKTYAFLKADRSPFLNDCFQFISSIQKVVHAEKWKHIHTHTITLHVY